MSTVVEELIESAKHLAYLEHSANYWKMQLEAAQIVRRKYPHSLYAQKTLKAKEKELKKLYWAAMDKYQEYKKGFLSYE